jgi:uncharacterized phage-like protein YoqJ
LLEIDEVSCKAIQGSIEETLKLIEEKKDIRIVTSSLGTTANKIRAMAELRETPDNEFVSLVFTVFVSTASEAFKDKDQEWLKANRDVCDQCQSIIEKLLQGMKSVLKSKDFIETVDVLKISWFSLSHILDRTPD